MYPVALLFLSWNVASMYNLVTAHNGSDIAWLAKGQLTKINLYLVARPHFVLWRREEKRWQILICIIAPLQSLENFNFRKTAYPRSGLHTIQDDEPWSSFLLKFLIQEKYRKYNGWSLGVTIFLKNLSLGWR